MFILAKAKYQIQKNIFPPKINKIETLNYHIYNMKTEERPKNSAKNEFKTIIIKFSFE